MQYTDTISLTTIVCPCCGMAFAAPKQWIDGHKESVGNFCCPAGHRLAFKGSETKRLKRELERVKLQNDRLNSSLTHARDQRDAAERSASAYKGQATRIKNRVAAGVCPCCKRTVSQLARHMETKHPEYAEGAKGGEE